jgi:hypothetical protein
MKRIITVLVATLIAPIVLSLWVLSALFVVIGTGFEKLSDFITENTIDRLGE